MSHTPPGFSYTLPGILHPWSEESLFSDITGYGSGTPVSATYATAQKAIYVPFILPVAATVYKLWWVNGGTVGTDNVQVGIYMADGTDGFPSTSVVLGTSTLSAGANSVQYDDIANTTLAPGWYHMAMWCSGTTATFYKLAGRQAPGLAETSLAGGLPATASASTSANFGLNACLFGLQLRSSP